MAAPRFLPARDPALARPLSRPLSWARRLVLASLLAAASAAVAAPGSLAERNEQTAEAMIDAFYAFDPAPLGAILADAGESRTRILWYQGWAEGANYTVVERAPCTAETPTTVVCPITVEDDPVKAIKTGFDVTDTFTLTFEDATIVAVETSSNDSPVYGQASAWVAEHMPEVMTGPCRGFFEDGPTPGDCARAMTKGYKAFAESDDYPL